MLKNNAGVCNVFAYPCIYYMVLGFNGRGWLGSRAILLLFLPHYFLNQFQSGFSKITFNCFAF